MAIHNLRRGGPTFAHSVRNVRGSNANSRPADRAERDAAAATVRSLVASEAQLDRSGDRPEELARVRARITAYCEDYPGLDALVDARRRHFRIPADTPAAAHAA